MNSIFPDITFSHIYRTFNKLPNQLSKELWALKKDFFIFPRCLILRRLIQRIRTYLFGCWVLSLFEDSHNCFLLWTCFKDFVGQSGSGMALVLSFLIFFGYCHMYLSHAMCFSLVLAYIGNVGFFCIVVGGMYVCYKRLEIL